MLPPLGLTFPSERQAHIEVIFKYYGTGGLRWDGSFQGTCARSIRTQEKKIGMVFAV